MLKSVQILGSTSGFLSLLWKKTYNSGFGLSFVAISANPLSYSTSSGTRGRLTTDTPVSPVLSAGKNGCFRSRRVYATRSEANQDVSSSSSSAAVQSAVKFF